MRFLSISNNKFYFQFEFQLLC